MRLLLLAALLVGITLGGANAQTASPQPSSTGSVAVATSPVMASQSTPRYVHVTGLLPGITATSVLFDPAGNQTVQLIASDASGTADLYLLPPSGQWIPGLYRLAVVRTDGGSASSTFIASDGAPHLVQEESLPSPFSAFQIVGTGLPANTAIHLDLALAGGFGTRSLSEMTDVNGTFIAYVWPQQFGFPFWSAGPYRVTAPNYRVDSGFLVREHPVSSAIRLGGVVLPDSTVAAHFSDYSSGRYLWVVYAHSDGTTVGESLVGPTDRRGYLDTVIHFADLSPGSYLMATPYDWGETAFTVPDPTATPTPTPTSTPTVTLTPTFTATPTPTMIPTATPKPTKRPRPKPTRTATPKPTKIPTPKPTRTPVKKHPCKKQKSKSKKFKCSKR